MMRFNITQLISHQSKMLTDFAHPKNSETKFDEAQDVRRDTRNRATSTKRSLNTTCRKRGPKPGTQETPTDNPAEAAPTT